MSDSRLMIVCVLDLGDVMCMVVRWVLLAERSNSCILSDGSWVRSLIPSETYFLDWDVGLTINDCQLARGSKKFPTLAGSHSPRDGRTDLVALGV